MAIDRDDLGSRLFGVALPPVLGARPAAAERAGPGAARLGDPGAGGAARPRAPAARRRRLRPADPLTVAISLPDAHEHATDRRRGRGRLGADRGHDDDRRPLAGRHMPRRWRAAISSSRSTSGPRAFDSPLGFLAPFDCAPSARRGTATPAADALVATARAAPDAATAATALASAEAAIVADTPVIALFTPVRWALVSRRVTGWVAQCGGAAPARAAQRRPAARAVRTDAVRWGSRWGAAAESRKLTRTAIETRPLSSAEAHTSNTGVARELTDTVH